MSEMYCWQSLIASGSQAARCCGVHCWAAAGQDANVSARPSNTRASVHPAYASRCRPTFLPLRGEDLEEAQWLMSFRFSKVRRSMTMQPK
jgi:hypothetical protein